MGFFSDLFGGPTADQVRLSGNQDILATQMSQAFQQQLGAQSALQQKLTNQLTPIASLGPNQQGFSSQELAALNTQAINTSGAAARNAAQSTGAVLAGRGGGGTSGITSGIDAQIRGSEASAAADQLASAQNDITLKNYDTGRQNFWNATSGEHALATTYNPEGFANLANSSNASALSDANQIQKERQAAAFGPISLATKLIGGVATGFAGGFGAGGLGDPALQGVPQSFGDKAGNFFQGAFNSLSGND